MDYENDTGWVRGTLLPGENLLWTGKPERVRFFRKEDLLTIPGGLIMMAFGIFIMTRMFDAETPLFAKIFMGVWLAMAAAITFFRPAADYLRKKRSRYALTSRRIIVDSGSQRRSLELTNLPALSVTRRRDGSGTIAFGETGGLYRRFNVPFNRRTGALYADVLELADLAEVDRVEYRIRTAAEQAQRAARE